jgi:hypothetical protein
VNYADFYQPAQPPASGQDAYQQQLAQALMKGQKGQMTGKVYSPPGAASYGSQLAGGLLAGAQRNQMLDGKRAQDILNGGTGEQFKSGLSKAGDWLSGLFGGGA